jgi:carbon monoxide dehydrogenase subunit G
MTIDDTFDIDASLERVWPVLNDVPRVASCIPNAAITEEIDSATYRANVSVKVGPVNVGYNATITIVSIDEALHTATIDIAGDEVKGRGGMKARVISHAEAVGERTHVSLHTEAQISGVVATVGGRLIESVARKTVADFAKKLALLV